MKEPDNTAVRTALWRALHKQVDEQPYIIDDEIGLKLVAPPEGWHERPDMKYTKRLRASIVARARFIEDLIIDQSKNGITQYVIMGAGLDTFALRRMDIASKLNIYEIDRPDTLSWKQHRINEIGLDFPSYLHFVPVNFETSSWMHELLKAGFDPAKPCVLACTGVTIYLTQDAITSMMQQITNFASGSVLAITFYLPMALLDDEDKAMQELGEKGARAAGTPFISFFSQEEIIAMANNTGFKNAKAISTKDMEPLYFANRTDNLHPASGEVFLVANT